MSTVTVITPHYAERPPCRRPGCGRDKILGGTEATNAEGSMNEKGSTRVLEVATSSRGPTETCDRICPQCRSADLLALGRVLADNTGMIRSAYRCRECATEFLLLWTERHLGPEPSLGPRDRRANT